MTDAVEVDGSCAYHSGRRCWTCKHIETTSVYPHFCNRYNKSVSLGSAAVI